MKKASCPSLNQLIGIAVCLILLIQVAKADFVFGNPENLGPTVNGTSAEGIDCVSFDGLERYISSNRPGSLGRWDLWVSSRETIDADWSLPQNLGAPMNTSSYDDTASISANGLELYFQSDRPGGFGAYDLWVSKRNSRHETWGVPENLGAKINTPAAEVGAWPSADGLELHFGALNRAGGFGSYDIWVTRRLTVNDPWGSPQNLGPVVNSAASDAFASLTADGLVMFFSEFFTPIRPGGFGGGDMWVSTRAGVDGAWGTPLNLGPIVNGLHRDGVPRISPDGSTLYFSSDRPGPFAEGSTDGYKASIHPIVDFNDDSIVDINDLVTLIEHWGQHEAAYDMGPMPWGDGVIDAADLEVLMGYWGQEGYSPSLHAHWMLDETEGDIAYDSAYAKDATVIGKAVWQPTSGMVDGALQFDGIDDHIEAPLLLDPTQGVFSVFAWIKGGAPGQVIFSQRSEVNWLIADAGEGALRTDLSDPIIQSRGGTSGGLPLICDVTITDNSWHRVGFVWDGSDRILYVDDIEVARDTLAGLEGLYRDFYIGAGKALETGTFWSGLIDDVRVYERVVTP